jgi:FkbH-like protein
VIKLVIWDLDDTLWRGTLADGETVTLIEHRAAFIRELNARGVINAVCSKNDFAQGKAQLVAFDLWDEIVFPHIAFVPKGAAIRTMIADMQLRGANVLFVDDNPLNLAEVAHAVPEIATLDITAPDADARLAKLVASQTGTRSRVADYRMLENKTRDRRSDEAQSNEDFLRSCDIKACVLVEMENLAFTDRIVELVNRANQLNYTGSRLTADVIHDQIIDVLGYCSWSVFAWDRYGNYGLVGFALMRRRPHLELIHFVFSCRAMHMGLERLLLDLILAEAALFDPECAGIDMPYSGSALARRMVDQVEEGGTRPVRVMCNCQSGGLAHFSSRRADIDFDSMPRVFSLVDLARDDMPDPVFPPFVVYGAGPDYGDPPWRNLAPFMEHGLYVSCVERLCQLAVAQGSKLLVILPPENLTDHQYHPWMNLTRERVIRFNAVWRDAFATFPIAMLEVEQLHGPEEMVDVNHHHPASLRKIAETIDEWLEIVGKPVDIAA